MITTVVLLLNTDTLIMVLLLIETILQLQIGTTTIFTPTTGPSGAIQVATGATVTIAPGASYTVPNQLSTPQYFEDYGSVTKNAAPLHDYGWDSRNNCRWSTWM